MTVKQLTFLAILAVGAGALLSDPPAVAPANPQSSSVASGPAQLASQPTSQVTWKMSDVAPGGLLAGFFINIPGNDVDDLVKSPAFQKPAEESARIETFRLTDNPGDNYGTLVRGYVIPPADGKYIFYLCSDDSSELRLSTDETPANKRPIASLKGWTSPEEWNKFPTQVSEPIELAAGRKYYVEVLHKQGGGPSHLAVGWQLPDGTLERPIPAGRLTSPLPPPEAVETTISYVSTLPAATMPGMHKFPDAIQAKGPKFNFTMSYLLFLPDDYDKSKKKYPLFIFLHGNTHQGHDLEGILNEGPAQRLATLKELRQWFPMIALFPQLPPDRRFETRGSPPAIVDLIRRTITKYRIDPDMVYLTGLSMGGQGTWHVALEAPEIFAAIVPLCARAVKPDQAAVKLKMPVWIICGGADGAYTVDCRRMRDVLTEAGAPVKYTEYPGEGHGVWDHCYPDRKFYEWLLANRRGQPATDVSTRPAGAATRLSQ